MTVRRIGAKKYSGLSTDVKPTGITAGSVFTELDTGKSYFFDGGWVAQALNISEAESQMIIRLAVSSSDENHTYTGKAPIGTSEEDPNWQIKRIDETNGIAILYAQGTASFTNIWNDRISYNYT